MRVKNYLLGLSAALCPSVLLAQEGSTTTSPTVTTLVNPQQVQTALTSNLSQWVVVGIGIGISVFIVYLGWRLLKRFTRG